MSLVSITPRIFTPLCPYIENGQVNWVSLSHLINANALWEMLGSEEGTAGKRRDQSYGGEAAGGRSRGILSPNTGNNGVHVGVPTMRGSKSGNSMTLEDLIPIWSDISPESLQPGQVQCSDQGCPTDISGG